MKRKSNAHKRNNELFELLRDRICFLEYLPNTKLSEDALAKEFNVSRTPIRWALNRLEFMDLVETIHGSGSYVTQLSQQQIKDIYELRISLISMAPQLGVRKITPRFVCDLQKQLNEIKNIEAQNIQVVSYQFTQTYLLVMSLIKNTSLRNISEQLYYQSIRIWFASLPMDELSNELNSQIMELEQLIEIAKLNDATALFALRKSNLSLNYKKLLTWSKLSPYIEK